MKYTTNLLLAFAMLFGRSACADQRTFDFQGQQFTITWTAQIGPVRLEDSASSAIAHILLENIDVGKSFALPTLGGDLGFAPSGRGERITDFFPTPGTRTYTSTVTANELPNGRIRVSSEIFGGLVLLVGPEKGWRQDIVISNVVPNLPTWMPPQPEPTPTLKPIPKPAPHSEVHAVIISGQAHPEQVFRSDAQVHLTGGVVALGKSRPNDSLTPMNWPAGLTITPDSDYLTGKKVPALTPNIVDVRIRNFRTGAEIEPQLTPKASKAD
jgi:hypothetical protein